MHLTEYSNTLNTLNIIFQFYNIMKCEISPFARTGNRAVSTFCYPSCIFPPHSYFNAPSPPTEFWFSAFSPFILNKEDRLYFAYSPLWVLLESQNEVCSGHVSGRFGGVRDAPFQPGPAVATPNGLLPLQRHPTVWATVTQSRVPRMAYAISRRFTQ